MPLTPSQRRTLLRKSADGSLEVENLLKVAACGDRFDAQTLRDLKAEHKWSDTGWEGRSRVVPLGRWADTICCFLEEGCEGLVKRARGSADEAEFGLSVLQEINTQESVLAMLAIGVSALMQPRPDPSVASKAAAELNHLLGMKRAPEISTAVEREVRDFLHSLLKREWTDVQRAGIVCALCWVGDAESLELIAQLPRFEDCWAKLNRSAPRAIKQRLAP